jgi:hypothetical protein
MGKWVGKIGPMGKQPKSRFPPSCQAIQLAERKARNFSAALTSGYSKSKISFTPWLRPQCSPAVLLLYQLNNFASTFAGSTRL